MTFDETGETVFTVGIGAHENTMIFADGFKSGGTSIWSSSFGEIP